MSMIKLEEAKFHLRVDHDFDDSDIQCKLDAAEEQAIQYLDRNVYATNEDMEKAISEQLAGDKPMVMNSSFKSAVFLLLGHLYANREGEVSGTITTNIKYGFEKILHPYRINLGV